MTVFGYYGHKLFEFIDKYKFADEEFVFLRIDDTLNHALAAKLNLSNMSNVFRHKNNL